MKKLILSLIIASCFGFLNTVIAQPSVYGKITLNTSVGKKSIGDVVIELQGVADKKPGRNYKTKTYADAQGNFAFYKLEPGAYELKIRINGKLMEQKINNKNLEKREIQVTNSGLNLGEIVVQTDLSESISCLEDNKVVGESTVLTLYYFNPKTETIRTSVIAEGFVTTPESEKSHETDSWKIDNMVLEVVNSDGQSTSYNRVVTSGESNFGKYLPFTLQEEIRIRPHEKVILKLHAKGVFTQKKSNQAIIYKQDSYIKVKPIN